MSKRKKLAPNRRQISIPAELNARMSKFDVNWSEVAREAFERKLGEIAAQKEKKDMKDVADRLRESMRQGDGEMYQAGFDDGTEWAKDAAEAMDLKRLERYREGVSGYDWDLIFSDRVLDDNYTMADRLAFAILGDGSDINAVRSFWEDAVGDACNENLNESSYVKGFAEGALDVWDNVKSQL